MYNVAQQLWIKKVANVRGLNKWKAIFILWLNERTLTACIATEARQDGDTHPYFWN